MPSLGYDPKYDSLPVIGAIGGNDAQYVYARRGITSNQAGYIARIDFNNDGVIGTDDAFECFAHLGAVGLSELLSLDNLAADMYGPHVNFTMPSWLDVNNVNIQNYSWGSHPVTNNVQVPSGYNWVNSWFVGEFDNSVFGTTKNAQIEMKPWKTYTLSKSTRIWTLRNTQLPTWTTVTHDPSPAGPYYDITGTTTTAGKKYQLPAVFSTGVSGALHFGTDHIPINSDCGGVCTQIVSRLVGTDKATAAFAAEAGADYRPTDANGQPDGSRINQAGAGRWTRLLTDADPNGGWTAVSMTASILDPLMEECHGTSYYPIQAACESEVTGYRNTSMAGLRANPPSRII